MVRWSGWSLQREIICAAVDGQNPANQLRLVVHPHYLQGFSTIPAGFRILRHSCAGCGGWGGESGMTKKHSDPLPVLAISEQMA